MGKPAIKAIETRFGGHRFRSRLEARWAVAFYEMGVDYVYEPEGFALPSGACYLPDFFLPDVGPIGTYVEVKPNFDIPMNDFSRVVEFTLAGEKQTILIIGVPSKENIYYLDRKTVEYTECYEDLSVKDILTGIGEMEVIFGGSPHRNKWEMVFLIQPGYYECYRKFGRLKGCEARFEHGETP